MSAEDNYGEKLRSLSFPRRSGEAETRTEKADGTTVTTTEHWDGRQDATVTPDVIRNKAIQHTQGRKRGQVAEVVEMTQKEREERYGPNG